jgi:hypothetical protein
LSPRKTHHVVPIPAGGWFFSINGLVELMHKQIRFQTHRAATATTGDPQASSLGGVLSLVGTFPAIPAAR